MSAIFLLPVCLTYWPRKYTTRVDPHVDNSHQVWSWYDHTLLSYSVFVWWYVTQPCDLDFWPFDLEQLSYIADHVANPATKYEDPTHFVYELWVITVPINYNWKFIRGHCACAESRDPSARGQNNYIFGIPDPDLPFHYTTFIGVRRRLSVVYSRAVRCYSRFRAKKI